MVAVGVLRGLLTRGPRHAAAGEGGPAAERQRQIGLGVVEALDLALTPAGDAAPDDLISTFNLAQALLELDPDKHRDEADRLLLQVIEAQPYGELAERAKDLRSSIARRDLRADQPDGLRQDAVSYCLQALQLFEGMDQQRFLAVLSEVGAVGQGGLQINEPGTSRSLKTLPGSWSDLALACLIHVGMKRLMPDEDSGLGIGAEYEEALRLHRG